MSTEREFLSPERIQAEYEFAGVYGLGVLVERLVEAHNGSVAAAIRGLIYAMDYPNVPEDDDLAGWCHLATLGRLTRGRDI